MSTKKIEKRIVGYAVKDLSSKEVTVKKEEPSYVQMNENLDRPEMLIGSTYKIKPGDMEHALYVTINDIVLNPGTEKEQRRPFEMFINSKSMEQFQWIVALTRIVSAVFRKGGDVEFLVGELKAVFDPKGGYWKPGTGVFVPSTVAEIGMVLEKHLQMIGMMKVDGLSDAQKALIAEKRAQLEASSKESSKEEVVSGGFPANATVCAKCSNKSVVVMDGCQTCLNCGNSKCG